jgi:hypothetical protein
MQGFIVNINRVKEEDLIVSILTKDKLHTLYRFYGARHGSINIGFKIDFEIEQSSKSTISREIKLNSIMSIDIINNFFSADQIEISVENRSKSLYFSTSNPRTLRKMITIAI